MISFVSPSVNGYKADNFYGGLQLAELAGRICYKTEGKASPGSYKDFLLNVIIPKNHLSILEHCPCYFLLDTTKYENKQYCEEILNIANSYFSRCVFGTSDTKIYTNLRVVYENYKTLAIEMINCNPSHFKLMLFKDYELEWFTPAIDDVYTRYTMNITTQRSTVDEAVRERITSLAVESTRWCDYSEEANKHNMTFCIPHWINKALFDSCFKNVIDLYKGYDTKDQSDSRNLYVLQGIVYALLEKMSDANMPNERLVYKYITSCIEDTIRYNELRDEYKLPAEDAREFLPLGVKSDFIYTAYYSDWLNILDKRLNGNTGRPHPNMVVIMKDIKMHLNGLRGE